MRRELIPSSDGAGDGGNRQWKVKGLGFGMVDIGSVILADDG